MKTKKEILTENSVAELFDFWEDFDHFCVVNCYRKNIAMMNLFKEITLSKINKNNPEWQTKALKF